MRSSVFVLGRFDRLSQRGYSLCAWCRHYYKGTERVASGLSEKEHDALMQSVPNLSHGICDCCVERVKAGKDTFKIGDFVNTWLNEDVTGEIIDTVYGDNGLQYVISCQEDNGYEVVEFILDRYENEMTKKEEWCS